MTQPSAILAAPAAESTPFVPRKLPRNGLNLAGLVTLFWLTFRQHARARKLLVLASQTPQVRVMKWPSILRSRSATFSFFSKPVAARRWEARLRSRPMAMAP